MFKIKIIGNIKHTFRETSFYICLTSEDNDYDVTKYEFKAVDCEVFEFKAIFAFIQRLEWFDLEKVEITPSSSRSLRSDVKD